MKKRKLLLVVSISLIMFLVLIIPGVLAASGVDLTITGTIGDYTSDVLLRTDDNAGVGFDAYDMPAPSSPDDYSSFYSDITSANLAIDSWEEDDRNDITLTYDMPDGQSGNVVFSWNDISSSADYTATFSITGGAVTDLNMVSDADNQYVYSAANSANIYVVIDIGSVATTTTTASLSSGGGGGGGVVTLPTINIIKDSESNKLLFDAAVIIPDEFRNIFEGDKMEATINLIPMGIDPDLDVYLSYYIIDQKTGEEVDVGDGESEMKKITGQTDILKTFFTDNLEPGEYELHLELTYESEPEVFLKAFASSEFVVKKSFGIEGQGLGPLSNYKIPLLALGVGIIVLILLIIVVIKGTKKLKNKKRK